MYPNGDASTTLVVTNNLGSCVHDWCCYWNVGGINGDPMVVLEFRALMKFHASHNILSQL